MLAYNPSINGDTESLRGTNKEQLLPPPQRIPDDSSDNFLRQKTQRNQQQQLPLIQQEDDAIQGPEVPLSAEPQQKDESIYTDTSATSLQNFLKKSTQFKVNSSQTQMYVINQEGNTIEVYKLPEFVKQSSFKPDPNSGLDKLMVGLCFLDVSEDGKFIAFGNAQNLIHCRTEDLFLKLGSQVNVNFIQMKLPPFDEKNLQPNDAKIPQPIDTKNDGFGVRFTEKNDILFILVNKRDGLSVQQINVDLQNNKLELDKQNQLNEQLNLQKIQLKSPQSQTISDFSDKLSIMKFSSCFYIKCSDCLYVYKPKDSQSKDLQGGIFWDPIKGIQVNAQISRVQSLVTGNQQMAQNQQNLAVNSDPFVGIDQCFVQDGVLLIQYSAGYIQIYTQKLGVVKGLIALNKTKIDLNSPGIIDKGMIAFRLYQGNLYFKNDADNKCTVDVVSFRDGKLKKLWNFLSDQKIIINPEHQVQTTHCIHYIAKEKNSSVETLYQLNGFSNELIFSQIWSNLRPKYSVIADGKVFQDGENDGSLIIYDKFGVQQVAPIGENQPNLNRYKNFIKNIYYSEELKQLVLLKSYDDQISLKEQIYLMPTQPNGNDYQYKELLEKKFSNQNAEIIGTMFESKRQTKVLLFVLKAQQNLVMYEIDQFKVTKQTTIIEKAEYINKQDIFLEKENKYIVVKMPDMPDSFEYRAINVITLIETKHFKNESDRLIKVIGNELHFLNDENKEIAVFDVNSTEQILSRNANFKIFQQANQRTQKQRDTEDKNERLIWTKNLIICQNETTIYIFDSTNLELKCQINNAPLDCTFIRTEYLPDTQQFYLISKSSIDGLIDIKAFKMTKDEKLFSLNDKQAEREKIDKEKAILQKKIELARQAKLKQEKQQGNPSTDKEQSSQQDQQQNQPPQQSASKPLEIIIPNEFQLSSDTFLIYDFFNPRVELYDNSSDTKELKIWTYLQSRSIISKSKLKDLNANVIGEINKIKFIENAQSQNISELMFFDTLHRNSIFHLIYQDNEAFTAVVDIFLKMDEKELPFLMLQDENKNTPLDLVIDNKQLKSIVSFLKLIVYHKSASKQYNRHIDKYLLTLIDFELNLKALFESEILYYSLTGYPQQEKDKSDFFYPALNEFQSEIEDKTNQVKIISEHTKVTFREAPKESSQKASQQDEKKVPQENQKKKQKEPAFPVDYKLIDMKQTLTTVSDSNINIKSLMQTLEDQTRTDILEFECIQRIIDYKWFAFTQQYFKVKFYQFLILCAFFYLSLFMQQRIMEEDLTQETLFIAGYDIGEFQYDLPFVTNLILTIGYSVISISFLLNEITQMWTQGFIDHFQDIWNINDFPLFVLLPIQGSLTIFQIVELQSTLMKSLKCIIIILIFIKMNYFLRIYDQFSFLVKMLQAVFKGLAAFFVFFLIVVAAFSCLIQILIPESQSSYEGAGPFAYLMMAFRASIGDFTFDSYKATTMKEATWVLWFVLTIVGNVVFMNFIIAVVNQAYTDIMAIQKSSQYKLKVGLIIEREKQLQNNTTLTKEIFDQNLKQLENEQKINNYPIPKTLQVYLPNFIVVRTSSTAVDDPIDQVSFQNQIQKTVDDMQKNFSNHGETLTQIRDIVTQLLNSIPHSQGLTAPEVGTDQAPPVLKTQTSRRQ